MDSCLKKRERRRVMQVIRGHDGYRLDAVGARVVFAVAAAASTAFLVSASYAANALVFVTTAVAGGAMLPLNLPQPAPAADVEPPPDVASATFGQVNRALLAAKQAEVEQQRALHRLRSEQLDALAVRAGIDGVVQEVPVEIGHVYVVRTRQQAGFYGRQCVYYGKFEPLEEDIVEGRLKFVFDISPVCNSRKLFPPKD